MKIPVPSISLGAPAGTRGNFLMVAVFTLAVAGALVIGCLSVVHSQNVNIARSQAWNECIPVIEAGIEEAMAHLNNHADTNLTSDSWDLQNGLYTQTRGMGSGYYNVGIIMTNALRPVIVCTGYVELPAAAASAQSTAFAATGAGTPGVQYISRVVRATAEKTQVYVKAMVSRRQIEMNGNNIVTDSFDSTDPNYSTPLGLYDPTKIKDNGDVATLWGLSDAIGVGNADIKGHLRTGPGGKATVGPSGKVGSLWWHANMKNGIQPGWSTDDMNVTFRDVELPFTGTAPAPTANVVGGVSYKYVLTNGNYKMSSLVMSSSERLLVISNAVLLVTDSIDISGSATLDVIYPAKLNLYMAGATATIGGLGINNTGRAGNFNYWGLPSNTTLTMKASADFTGSIYAPNADLKMSGGGNSVQNFVGACVMRSITINGHYSFHYDEALGKFGPPSDYIITSWIEL